MRIFKIFIPSKIHISLLYFSNTELLGTVDFVTDDGTVAFRTCPEEKSRLVFQLGTSHPKRALRVAQMV